MIQRSDVQALMRAVGRVMRTSVDALRAELTGLNTRLLELETRPIQQGPIGPQGEKGEPGISVKGETGAPGLNGKDAEPVNVGVIVADILRQLPAPIAGRDGQPGKDAPPVDIAAIIGEVLRQIPTPKDGAPGRDGTDGKTGESIKGDKGEPGKDGQSPSMEAIVRMVSDECMRAVALLPKARDGQNGRDGRDIDPDVIRLFIATQVAAAGESWKSLARGKHQRSLQISTTDPRTLIQRTVYSDGEIEELSVKLIGVPQYQGIYRAATDYEIGDQVTHDGSMWHCRADSTRAVPGKSEDWQLSVKKGSDGKRGLDGKDGERGLQGLPGKDLRYE